MTTPLSVATPQKYNIAALRHNVSIWRFLFHEINSYSLEICKVYIANHSEVKDVERNGLGLNPKGHGLFGQLDTWGGGWNPPILKKRSVIPPNFIPKQQTVSHMKAEIFG